MAQLRRPVLALLACCLAAATPAPAADRQPAAWSLSALLPPGVEPGRRGTPLWIELRNDSPAVRLVCVDGAIVALKSPAVTDGRARTIDGASCGDYTDFVLVRPGQTLSKVVFVKSRSGVVGPDTEPLIDLAFYERDLGDPAAERRRVFVRWVGSITDAQQAGRQLLPAAGTRR